MRSEEKSSLEKGTSWLQCKMLCVEVYVIVYFQKTTPVSNSAPQWADGLGAPVSLVLPWQLMDSHVKVFMHENIKIHYINVQIPYHGINELAPY